MANSATAMAALKAWFSALPSLKQTGGLPARGSVAVALVVLERLKLAYTLDLDAHRTEGKAQIQGVNPSALKNFLARFGEKRPFLREAGRTNRGAPATVQTLFDSLSGLQLKEMSEKSRNEILTGFQAFLVERVQEYHAQNRLSFVYEPENTTSSMMRELLRAAGAVGKAGPVAQYLVGSKLQLCLPDLKIPNERYSAGDVQTGRSADFELGDTAFHVTVSPGSAVLERCKQNVENGLRVYLLVPDGSLLATRQNADMVLTEPVAVESLESFLANNIEELSVFTKNDLREGFHRLLETYNARVRDIEDGNSMLMEIPRGLES